MGASTSRPSSDSIVDCLNDYELVIRACKELDSYLRRLTTQPISHDAHFAGLHDILNACKIPHPLEKQVRYLITVRNGLIHDVAILKLDDRKHCLETFIAVRESLSLMLNEKVAKLEMRKPRKTPSASSSSTCVIS